MNSINTRGGTLPDLSNYKVLVADQTAGDHALLRGVLREIGVKNMRSCLKMEETMKAIASEAPDLILLELGETGATGLNFMRAVRAGKTKAAPDVPIIIMSKTLSPDIAFKASKAGFENFIRKPMEIESIKRRINTTIKQPRRFVVGRAYFGPERRISVDVTYSGKERRGGTLQPETAVIVSEPSPLIAIPKTNGGKIETSPIENSVKPAAKVELVEEAKTKPAPKARIEPDKKTAAVPPAKKDDPAAVDKKPTALSPEKKKTDPVKAAPVKEEPKEKVAIELAEKPEKKAEEPGIDIPAILESHALWLTSRGAQGEKASLPGANLSGVDMAEANLASANLRDADLQDCNLAGVNFEDADLRGANLSGSNLAGAELSHIKLRHASLKAAQLPEAILRAADLAGANLQGAGFAGADFKDVNLLSTDIRGAELLGVNLTQKQIDKARGDATTKLPPGIRLPAEK